MTKQLDIDIEEGLEQARNGELIPLEDLKEELELRIKIELDQAVHRLENSLKELRALHKSWDLFAQESITKIQKHG